MESLNEVFIKEVTEAGIDKVIIVKNLPKHFVYTKAPKQVVRVDRDGYTDGTLAVDPNGGMVDALHEGIEKSQSGDESLMFLMNRESGKLRLKAIDAYIQGTLPRDILVPARVPYSSDPTNMSAPPRAKSTIPVIELPFKADPAPLSPPVEKSTGEGQAASSSDNEAKKQAMRERMAKARASKQVKTEQINS